MNARERFLRIMDGDTSIRTLKWEFGYWVGTIRRWKQEGLNLKRNIITDKNDDDETCTGGGIPSPELSHPVDYDVAELMGFDAGLVRMPVEHWYYPHFEPKILKETDHTFIVIDHEGIQKEVMKKGGSMPKFLSFPVENRADFEQIKDRLKADSPGRFPSDWKARCSELKSRDYPLAIGGKPFGFFGSLRELMGFENCMTMFYDDPEFVQDILQYLSDFWYALYEKILADVLPDYVLIFEDMSYKAGPMINPALFRDLMIPHYKRMIGLFKSKGIKNIFVDTDGNCESLIPVFLEGGVTGLLPLEQQAGMDVAKIAKQFPELMLMGGIDKKVIINGGEEAWHEVLHEKIPSVLKRGKYIPYIDHLVSPDISWDRFTKYRKELDSVIEESIKVES
jgi:uroporphyrinogen decarboxylase